MVDFLRIDDAAVAQDDPHLMFEHGEVEKAGYAAGLGKCFIRQNGLWPISAGGGGPPDRRLEFFWLFQG